LNSRSFGEAGPDTTNETIQPNTTACHITFQVIFTNNTLNIALPFAFFNYSKENK